MNGPGLTRLQSGGLLLLAALIWGSAFVGQSLGMAGVGLAVYAVAAWGLPQLLLRWTGMRMDGLFMRMADGSQTCVGRATLWSNVLELIAQRGRNHRFGQDAQARAFFHRLCRERVGERREKRRPRIDPVHVQNGALARGIVEA